MYTLTNIMCHISASMKTRADDLSEMGHTHTSSSMKLVFLCGSVEEVVPGRNLSCAYFISSTSPDQSLFYYAK